MLGAASICSAALLLCTVVASTSANAIPLIASPGPAHTYAVAPGPAVVTAHSHQVVTRNHNRLYTYVPTVPAVTAVPAVPAYAYAHASFGTTPIVYRYGAYPYGYYPSYGYSYSTTYW